MPMHRQHPVLLLMTTVALLAGVCGTAHAADADLAAITERLESVEAWDRIGALRDLMRLRPAPEKARPILENALVDPDEDVRGEVVWGVYELLGAEGADLLEKLYADPQRRVRDSASRAACRLWETPRTRDLCTVAFEDPDFGARIEVINTLKENFPQDPGAAKVFRKGLSDPSEMVQRSAVFGVQAARDEPAVPALAKIARTSSNQAAVPAVEEALATIGNDAAVEVLISLLPKPKAEKGAPPPSHPTELVRAAAARALARIKDPSALPELRKLVNDPSIPIRIGAMEALMQMGDRESVPLIAEQLRADTARVRQFSLRALRRIGDPSCAKDVRRVLREDEDEFVRATAAISLADLLGEEAIPDLLALKDDLSAAVRLEAAGALAGLGDPAIDALAVFLTDSNPSVRLMAVEGLGQVRSPEHLAAIAQLANDTSRDNVQVRMKVAEALGRIGSPEALPTLEQLAGDASPAVRQSVATALGEFPQQKKADELLATLEKDPVATVRAAARRARGK
jgi:HEAT repeat protein